MARPGKSSPRQHLAQAWLTPTAILRQALLLLALQLAGTTAAAPQVAWPHESSNLVPPGNVIWRFLPNGMRIVVLPYTNPPKRISLRLFVAVGSLMEEEDQQGLAHLLEHMAFQGSENLPPGELARRLERFGMDWGADINAHTLYDRTVYALDLPANDAASLDLALGVLREIADRLLLPADRLETERNVVLSELRQRDTPTLRAIVAEFEAMLPGTRLARRWSTSKVETVGKAPRHRLVSFYRRWYVPGNTYLVVVGDVDPRDLETRVAKTFASFTGRLPAPLQPEHITDVLPEPRARWHHDPEATTTTVSLHSFQELPRGDNQARRAAGYQAFLAQQMLSKRLAALDTVSLQEVRLYDWFGLRIGSVVLNASAESWRDALGVAEQELRRSLEHGFTEAELEEQKKELLKRQEIRAASFVNNWHLADELVESLAQNQVFTHPQDDLTLMRAVCLRTTPAEIAKVWERLWLGEPVVMVSGVAEPPAEGEAAVLAAYRASRQVPVEPFEAPAASEVTRLSVPAFGEPSAVLERREFAEIGVTQIRFGNHVRLNLRPNPGDSSGVAVLVRFGGGLLEAPRDKPGLKLLAELSFLHGGLTTQTFDEIRSFFAPTFHLVFLVRDESFSLMSLVFTERLADQLRLMAGYLSAPGFRPESQRRFDQQVEKLYQGLEQTAAGIIRGRVERLLYGGDPRFGLPERQVAASRTLAELRAWLAEPLRHGYLEVNMSGDFDLEEAIGLVASTFGSLPPRAEHEPDYADGRRVKFPAARELVTLTYKTRHPTAWALSFWPTTDRRRNHRDALGLTVLGKVLESRLRSVVRDALGASYGPTAGHKNLDAFPGFGYLSAVLDVPAEKAVEMTELMRQCVEDLRRIGITEDELTRAREPMLKKMETSRLDNRVWVDAFLRGSQTHPERLRQVLDNPKDLGAFTVEELNAVARKYLVERPLPVVVLPRQP